MSDIADRVKKIPDDAAETIQSFGDAVKFITEAS